MSKILNIKRPRLLKRGYNVYDGVLLANFQSQKRLRGQAIATIENQTWVLQKDLLTRSITVTNSKDNSQLFTFKADTLKSSGSIDFNGEQYFYKLVADLSSSRSIIKPVNHVWFDANQQPVVSIKLKSLTQRTGAATILQDDISFQPKILMLIILTLFKIVEESRNNVA